MTTTHPIYDEAVILSRAQAGYEAEQSKLEPQGFTWVTTLASASGIAIACASEAYSLTIALKAQYEAMSDGTDLGHDLLSIRLCIVAALLLTHGFLHDEGGDVQGRPVRRWLRQCKALPVLGVIGGLAVFSFIAMATATGGDDGQSGMAGMSLGCAVACLFSVSFFACNALMRRFIPAVRTLLAARAQRTKVASIAHDLEATDTCRAAIVGMRRDLAAKPPHALRRTAAAEAAAIVGKVAGEADAIHAMREALGDDLPPHDVVEGLPDTPLPVLDRLQKYLKQFDVAFFLTLLTKEA